MEKHLQIKMKNIIDLQQGDIIQSQDGGAIEIISNNKGLIYVYNQITRDFREYNLRKNAKEGDKVFIY